MDAKTRDVQASKWAGPSAADKKLLSVLFVCHGNICRSPMAEFVMKKELAANGLGHLVGVESAATSTEEIGNDIHPGARYALEEHGVPFYSRRARRVTNEDYGSYDLIVGMDEQNVANLKRFFKNDPKNKVTLLMKWAGEDRGIADPWYTGDFEATYRDVETGTRALANHLAALIAKARERAGA